MNVKCTTKTATHPKVGIALWAGEYGVDYTVSTTVNGSETAGFTCDVTVKADKYVAEYGKKTYLENGQTVAYGPHQLKQGEALQKVLTLVYDRTANKWTVPTSNEVTFEVECGTTAKPSKPALNEGSPVLVRCVQTDAHPNDGTNSATQYFALGGYDYRYEEVLKDGASVWKDEGGTWTYQLKLKREKFVEDYNKRFPDNPHTDLSPKEDTFVTWKKPAGKGWELVTVGGLRKVGAIIEVTCKPKAPTADDLKKLEMAVQVKCVVDKSQQHTDAYGLLGEDDKDYFVGEPKKDGDDWLCDISYLPDLYVAEFNKTFPNPKHVQNDEKIVPVTLIWAGDSWQVRTQGRVHVTEEYTVTFDTDGGVPAPNAQNVLYGGKAAKPTTDPAKDGFEFVGWYLSDAAYDFNAAVTGDITLTAHYERMTVTVTFDPNGGNELAEADKTKVVKIGEAYGELPTPTRTGYDFLGWFTAAEDGDQVTANTTVTATADHTLYAQWQKKTFTVKYYLPDETGAWVEKHMDTVDSVDYATYILWTPNAEDGYEFSGWYQKTADIGVKAKVEQLYMAKEWKLYGKFTPIEYTIQYVYNDGKATSTNPTTYTIESGTITLADATGADWGKTFLEWHDENGQKITEIPAGSTGNRVITAYWNWPVYLHYLDKDNNEIDSATLYVSELDPSACVLPTGEKIGYDFDGWYEAKKDIGTASHKLNALSIAKKWELYGRYTAKTDVSYTVKYVHAQNNKELAAEKTVKNQIFDTTVTETAIDIPGYTVDEQTKTLKLDAYGKEIVFKYTPNKYTVTFDANGGTLTGQETKQVNFGSKYGNLSTAERAGYTFEGWYTEKDGGTQVTEKTVVKNPNDHTLYAHWTANPFLLIYHSNYNVEGMDEATSQSPQWKTDDYVTLKHIESAGFAKPGYTFAGWNTKADGSGKLFTETGAAHKVQFTAADIDEKGEAHLYAQWTPNTYTVEFKANGGEGTMADQTFTYDVEQALNANAFTKTGYTFAGWKDAAGNTYTDGQKVKNLATEGTVTLTAQWTANKYTVTFNANGGTDAEPASKPVTYDAEYGTLATTSRKGYTLVGWFTAKDGGTEVESTTVVATAGDHTLYAHWTPNTYNYEIHYYVQQPDGNYVEDASALDTTKTGTFDSTVTVTPDANKYGAHFSVNNTKSKLSGVVTVDTPAEILKLEVYYDRDFHTLTYLDSRNGSVIGTTTVRCGVSVAAPKDPTKAGYWFDGWYNAADNKKVTFPVTLTNDMTVYAGWTMIVLPSTITKKTPKLNTADHFAYVQGYPDGTVKPAGNITRAETAAILFRLMDDTSRNNYYSTKSGFRDVAAGSWYNTYVATLNNAGVITDSANGYFRPNDAITRAELAAMLAAFTDTTRAANYFNDVTANYWAANAIAVCAKLGWINGYPDGSFRPDRNVTRAELMAMINRATGRAPKSADAFLPGMKTWSDNTADKWYYLDVQEATNSHSYTVRPTEIWTAITAAPNWSKYE